MVFEWNSILNPYKSDPIMQTKRILKRTFGLLGILPNCNFYDCYGFGFDENESYDEKDKNGSLPSNRF